MVDDSDRVFWLSKALVGLPRAKKRALMLAADSICIPLALWLSIVLKTGVWSSGLGASGLLYIAAVASSVPVFARLGLYRAVIRFIGPKVIGAVLIGVTGSAVALGAMNFALGESGVPFATLVIYWAFALLYVGGSRFAMRSLVRARAAGAERVVVYGAGAAGAQAVAALRAGGRFHPVAFLDDDKSLRGSIVAGLHVRAPSDLGQLVADGSVTTVLLAMPSQSRRRRQEILRSLESSRLKVMTVPDISDLLSGAARIEDVRAIDVTDLLGRDPVRPDDRLFDACIRDKVVMVTGAGGSIGSELCRQIVRLKPRRLVILELSEYALYQVEREILEIRETEQLKFEFTALLGNAQQKGRMREIISAFGVKTIYHAAAYKHVPIVEKNVLEGVKNNVIGTWSVAEAALESEVETFLLVSTDKAVNPVNVMGATKRLAEIVLQGIQQRSARTKFCMVRFGNVLESSGSVVPLFRQQIARGGPITVTHPDVIRYFMTIPEATQLVLQAGAMAAGGDVFVLDMGHPVRIAELARRMVNLAGLTVRDESNPGGDIEIQYTGLRPAEKLFEELLIGNNVARTQHPMIMRATEYAPDWEFIEQLLQKLRVALEQSDVCATYRLLQDAVCEYQPAGGFVDLLLQSRGPSRGDSSVFIDQSVSRAVVGGG